MAYYRDVKVLADDFIERYGGMMTVTDLAKELGTCREYAKKWGMEKGLGIMINSRIKFESRLVAKAIVNGRGMC